MKIIFGTSSGFGIFIAKDESGGNKLESHPPPMMLFLGDLDLNSEFLLHGRISPKNPLQHYSLLEDVHQTFGCCWD